MNECPHNLTKEQYDSKDSYPICKYCIYVSSGCPYLTQGNFLDTYMNELYGNMSEEELREELKNAEQELFM